MSLSFVNSAQQVDNISAMDNFNEQQCQHNVTKREVDRPIHQFSSRCEHSLQSCAKDNSNVPTCKLFIDLILLKKSNFLIPSKIVSLSKRRDTKVFERDEVPRGRTKANGIIGRCKLPSWSYRFK